MQIDNSHSATPPWRGFIAGEPVTLDLAEVRRRWPATYDTHWQVARGDVQIASSAERARELHWPKVVDLFVAARREDAAPATMVRDAEARR